MWLWWKTKLKLLKLKEDRKRGNSREKNCNFFFTYTLLCGRNKCHWWKRLVLLYRRVHGGQGQVAKICSLAVVLAALCAWQGILYSKWCVFSGCGEQFFLLFHCFLCLFVKCWKHAVLLYRSVDGECGLGSTKSFFREHRRCFSDFFMLFVL